VPVAPKVAAEHERLAAFAGDWVGDEVVGTSPWFEAGPASGHVHARIGLGGFYLIQEYRQERAGRTIFTGHGLITFDREDGRYKMFWHDSVGFVPESPAVGHWAGDTLTLRRASLRGTVRHVFKLEGPDSYALRLQFSPDDEGWSDLLTATYRRATPASGAQV
jgi:hypothetical protein